MAAAPGRGSGDAVALRWLESGAREEAAGIWRALDAGEAISATWDWNGTWLEHYGDVVPHRFAVGEVSGDPCGIALVTEAVGRRRGPFRVRSVHLGTTGEPPGESVFVCPNNLLVDAKHRAAFASALVEALRAERGWHELVLDRFVADDARVLARDAPSLELEELTCRVMDLRSAEDNDGSVMAALKSRTRSKIRRSLRGLGAVETEWAQTSGEALEVLDDLIELHQRRWRRVGEPGAFASPRVVAFHRDLVPKLLARDAVVLFRVRAAGGTVGCRYAFVEGGRVLGYQSGLASYEDNRISPGFVTHVACMQAAFERGMSEYDFQVGDSAFKRELSTTAGTLIGAVQRRPAFRWRLMDLLAAARRGLRREPDRP